MEFYSKDGVRQYIYSVGDGECSAFFYSDKLIDKSVIEEECATAWRIYDERWAEYIRRSESAQSEEEDIKIWDSIFIDDLDYGPHRLQTILGLIPLEADK